MISTFAELPSFIGGALLTIAVLLLLAVVLFVVVVTVRVAVWVVQVILRPAILRLKPRARKRG